MCGFIAEKMFSYELKVCHQPSGEEIDLQLLNLPNVEPLLRGVRDELRNLGVSESDVSKYIPPQFLAHEFVMPNCPPPPPVVINGATPCQPEGGQLRAAASSFVECQEESSSTVEVFVKEEPGKVSCDVCGGLFSKSNLARHKKTHSTAPLPFACSSPCKARALRREQILSHQMTSACVKYELITNRKNVLIPFLFSICPFLCRYSGSVCVKCNEHVPGSMPQHLKMSCTGAFPCNLCPASYSRLRDLKAHLSESHVLGME